MNPYLDKVCSAVVSSSVVEVVEVVGMMTECDDGAVDPSVVGRRCVEGLMLGLLLIVAV